MLGTAMAATIIMMAITMSSSIKVNPAPAVTAPRLPPRLFAAELFALEFIL